MDKVFEIGDRRGWMEELMSVGSCQETSVLKYCQQDSAGYKTILRAQ